MLPDTGIPAIGDRTMEVGAAFDILLTGTPVFESYLVCPFS